MKEYTLLLRRGQAKPYTLGTFKTLEGAKMKLNDMVDLEIKRNRAFFVDNDYYNNIYEFDTNIFYLCILERECSSYKKVAENSSSQIFLNII